MCPPNAAPEPLRVETEILVIGSGAAGMYAAIEAARADRQVMLIDRSLIGRGGATVMAQMTVAVALGVGGARPRSYHYHDTLAAGRGLCNERWPIALRRSPRLHPGDGCLGRRLGAQGRPHHLSLRARPRSAALRLCRFPQYRAGRLEDHAQRGEQDRGNYARGRPLRLDLAKNGGAVTGAVAWHVSSGAPVVISAKATIVATGGLTRLYRRNSGSANMGGDGYASACAPARR